MYRIGQSTISHFKKVIPLNLSNLGKCQYCTKILWKFNGNCLVNSRMYRRCLHPPFLSPSAMCVHCEREGVDGDNYGWAKKRRHRISRKFSSFSRIHSMSKSIKWKLFVKQRCVRVLAAACFGRKGKSVLRYFSGNSGFYTGNDRLSDHPP